MKGVVAGPIMVAILVAFLTGSGTDGAIAFFLSLGVMAVLLLGEFGRVLRRR